MITIHRLQAAVGAGAFLTAMALAACGGGGGSSPTPSGPGASGGGGSTPTSAPTVAPTISPTTAPTVAPTTTPQNVVRTAPLSSNPAASSVGRKPSALGGSASVLIESTGAVGQWAGNIVVWVTNTMTGIDVAETTGHATTTNGLAIDNPGLSPLTCTGNVTSAAWCASHPFGWYFGTDSGLVKPLGQQTITITFGDGATGTLTDDVYNGFNLACSQSFAYQGNAPVIVTTGADVTYDCVNQQVVFPHGYVLASAPQTDGYGRTTTAISTILAKVDVPTGSPTILPFASFAPNAVYVFATSDGGFAKMLSGGVNAPSFNGLALHANADGSYAY